MVSHQKVTQMAKQNQEKTIHLETKLMTIERHLPIMIQEILEFYFEKRVSSTVGNMVTKEEMKEALSLKMNYDDFALFRKRLDQDRTQEYKNFEFEEKIHKLDRQLLQYVTKDSHEVSMREKASNENLEEIQTQMSKLQQLSVQLEEKLVTRVTTLRSDYENKTSEMIDQLRDLQAKVDEFDVEDVSYGDEDEDEDLGSELEDTLDVNDMNKQFRG